MLFCHRIAKGGEERYPPRVHVLAAGDPLSEVLGDLEQRFGLKRVVFVGDRGMVTSGNLDFMRERGHGYIICHNRRRSGAVFDCIQSATGPWIECPVGITAREKQTPPKTLVQEVASTELGVRVFVVHSEERQAFEQSQRVKAMARVRARLEKLARRITKGRLKKPEKIGAVAARILASPRSPSCSIAPSKRSSRPHASTSPPPRP